MNILVFSWRDPKHPLAGGAEQVMHEHMKGWISAGHTVTLFSSKMPKLAKEEELDGIKIFRRGNQYLGVQLAAFLFYLKNKDKYDIVVDQFHGLPFFTPLYVRKPKIAVIQEIAGKVWFLNPFPFPLNIFVGIIGYIGEPFIFLFYKKVPFITGSQSAKAALIKVGIGEKNIHIIPHGVLTQLPSKNVSRENRFTIVFLGIHSKDKGIEDALRCFGYLKQQNFQFWTIGKFESSDYEKLVKNLNKELGLNQKTKFWGFVSQQEKFKLLAKAHILINPSVHEGWGLVNIEANVTGLPVISYNSAGLIDSVRDGVSGIICKENSPKDLANNVLRVFNDKDLYMSLQKGAINWSKQFSWEKSKKLSLQLLQQVS